MWSLKSVKCRKDHLDYLISLRTFHKKALRVKSNQNLIYLISSSKIRVTIPEDQVLAFKFKKIESRLQLRLVPMGQSCSWRSPHFS